MVHTAIDLGIFPAEREAGLKAIYRYKMFDVMYYRPNLWEHSSRVLWIVEALLPHVSEYVALDPEKSRIMALVHDDAEMITGD